MAFEEIFRKEYFQYRQTKVSDKGIELIRNTLYLVLTVQVQN